LDCRRGLILGCLFEYCRLVGDIAEFTRNVRVTICSTMTSLKKMAKHTTHGTIKNFNVSNCDGLVKSPTPALRCISQSFNVR